MIICVRAAVLIFVCCVVAPVSAELQGRLRTNPTSDTHLAYYDTILDITWLANASLAKTELFDLPGISIIGQMSWHSANAYVDAMNNTAYLGANTWRLPIEKPLNGTAFDNEPGSNDGTTDHGRGDPNGWIGSDGVPVSELGHMYYSNLGLPLHPALGTAGGTEYGIIVNSAPIISLEDGRYYSSTDYSFDDNFVWSLDFASGTRTFAFKDAPGGNFVWPVVDGDIFPVVVRPVPLNVPLILPGLALVYCMRRREREYDRS